MDFPRTRVSGSRASPSLRDSERWRGRSGRTAASRAPAEPSRCPRARALTLRATRSSCHASSSSAAQQPYPSPGPCPRAPPPSSAEGRAGGGGLAGSLPACGGRAVGAAARRGRGRGSRSRSRSWDGGDGPGRYGRRGAAPLLTTQLPAPHPRRPARARARGPQHGDASLERPASQCTRPHPPSPEDLQSSALCPVLHPCPRVSSSSRPGARSVAVFPSFQALTASPCIPPRRPDRGRDAADRTV